MEQLGSLWTDLNEITYLSVFRKSAEKTQVSLKSCQNNLYRIIIGGYRSNLPVQVAPRSKAFVCGRLPAEIVGSNPTGGMYVCCECCVLSGRGLCVGLITSPEESYRLWCVVVCDLETSWMRRPWPTGVYRAKNKQTSLIYSWEFEKY
jgi:hypothetical protein